MSTLPPNLSTALGIFTRSFARSRSIVSPAEAVPIGRLIVVRDVDGHRPQPRGQEIMVPAEVDIDEALDGIRAYAPPERHAVCVLRNDAATGKAAIASMKRNGYRYLRSEPMMARSTANLRPREIAVSVEVRRVTTPADADAVAKFARGRQVTEADLTGDSPAVRIYIGEIDSAIVSYARLIDVGEGITYLGGMYTADGYRRRGIATAVLAAALDDDRRRRVIFNVLLASRAGERLYLSMGYETISTLYVFAPTKVKAV